MVVTSVSSAGIPSSYLPSVAAYHQLHSGQTSCQCCLFSTKLKYWSLLPVLWLCLALSVTLCAMMQQNRTCTIDQATPTKFLIFTLLATVSKCHNSHSWSKHNCGINATPLPTPLLPFHYNLPESAGDHFSLWQGCVLVVDLVFPPGTITNNSENSFQQYRRQPE